VVVIPEEFGVCFPQVFFLFPGGFPLGMMLPLYLAVLDSLVSELFTALLENLGWLLDIS
jgi:hypothetical protein